MIISTRYALRVLLHECQMNVVSPDNGTVKTCIRYDSMHRQMGVIPASSCAPRMSSLTYHREEYATVVTRSIIGGRYTIA